MPKNYNEEQDSRKMMERINQNSKACADTENSVIIRYYTEQEKWRRASLAKAVAGCVVSAVAWVLFGMACDADLIAPVLVLPATYLCAIYFGWSLRKVVGRFRKRRWSK